MNHSTSVFPLARQRGLTLIELMVALVIGLVVMLAVTSVVTVGESHKRATTSNNDVSQSGAFAAYSVDRLLRSAGSGFAQAWNLGTYGCRLNASRDIGGTPTAILPRTIAFPAPFAGFLGGAGGAAQMRVAPLLIGNGQSDTGSDVLMVMGGNGAAGDAPRRVLVPGALLPASSLRTDNTVGLANGDIGIVTQEDIADCTIEQVNVTNGPAFNAAGNEELPLGSTYYSASTAFATMRASGTAYYTTLGNVGANNLQFQLIGVGANRTLFSYDLLRAPGDGSDGAAMQALADNVTELHAMYGLDTDGNGIAETWMDPGAVGYDIATLMATPATMRQIVAVRVALVLRSSLYDKQEVTLERPALFAGTAGAIAAVAITGADRHYRLRVIDTTIPLRNMLLLAAP